MSCRNARLCEHWLNMADCWSLRAGCCSLSDRCFKKRSVSFRHRLQVNLVCLSNLRLNLTKRRQPGIVCWILHKCIFRSVDVVVEAHFEVDITGLTISDVRFSYNQIVVIRNGWFTRIYDDLRCIWGEIDLLELFSCSDNWGAWNRRRW